MEVERGDTGNSEGVEKPKNVLRHIVQIKKEAKVAIKQVWMMLFEVIVRGIMLYETEVRGY